MYSGVANGLPTGQKRPTRMRRDYTVAPVLTSPCAPVACALTAGKGRVWSGGSGLLLGGAPAEALDVA